MRLIGLALGLLLGALAQAGEAPGKRSTASTARPATAPGGSAATARPCSRKAFRG